MRTLSRLSHTSTKRRVQRSPEGDPPTLVAASPTEAVQAEGAGR
jgi:hypothetical protein